MQRQREVLERPDGENLAPLADRAVAFSIDAALFGLGYLLTLKALLPGAPAAINPQGPVLSLVWVALFLVYQAYASSEGRVSIGKRLLGLRVVTLNHEPLSLPQALLRSTSYLLSSIWSLGFLWSLFNPARQCWHDLAAGSVVVEDRPKSGELRVLARAGALACLALLAVGWMWNNVWAARYYDNMTVAYAHVGLQEIDHLQKKYLKRHGRYAQDLIALSSVSIDPRGFLGDMANLFNLGEGVEIKTSKTGYVFMARALDARGTRVTHSGS